MAAYLQHAHLAQVVFEVSVGAFAIGELWKSLRWRRDARADVPAEIVFRVVFFAGILLLPISRKVVPGAVIGGAGVFVLGAVVGWLGLLLRWWSFATLGRYFTTVVKASPDQPVVDRGPYRWLRHPSYTGLLLVFLGCGLMLGNWVGAAASVVIVLAALVYRLRREERAMVAAVGESYSRFASSRARLVPYLW
jgi:protein-S-isoprenylcysteine O-methyltransferase Ste14